MPYYRSTTGKYVQASRNPGPSWRSSGPPPTQAGSQSSDVSGLSIQAAEDRSKQQKREKSAIQQLQAAIKLFDKSYGKGMEATAKASAISNLINTGLGGTTRPGAVSGNLSATFEDMRRGKLSGARTNLANFLGSYRDPTMVTAGTVMQGIGQEQQFSLGQGRLALDASRRTGGGGGSPSFTPGPAPSSQPTSIWEPLSGGNFDTVGTGGRTISRYNAPETNGSLNDNRRFDIDFSDDNLMETHGANLDSQPGNWAGR